MIMWGLVCGRYLSGLFQKQIICSCALNKTCSQNGPVSWMATSKPAPLLRATPYRASIDEVIALKAYHLPRNFPVTMRARMTCEDGHLWQSISHYYADEDGVVDLTKHSSFGGSYVGCEPMGLFWSLQPAPGGKQGLSGEGPSGFLSVLSSKACISDDMGVWNNFRKMFLNSSDGMGNWQIWKGPINTGRLRKKHVETPYTVDVSMLEGHISPLNSCKDKQSSGEHELATVSLQRCYMVPGVRRIEIRQNGVVGTLFLPPGPGPFPAVLDLWGLARGLVEYRAALFASHGLASMTLAYFGHENLPGPPKRINVGDSYFKGIPISVPSRGIQTKRVVCEDRIAISGISFGVFIALRIATSLPVNPKCVVCINGPFCSINKLFSDDGENIDGEQKHWSINAQGYVSFKDICLPRNVPPENVIQIEKVRCPLLFIVGEEDLCCPSTENADEIERRLHTAGKSHLFTRVSYPGAGHLIEPPYTPTSHTSVWASQPTQSMIQWGGNLKQHAAAQEDSWQRILRFLESNLRGEDTD